MSRTSHDTISVHSVNSFFKRFEGHHFDATVKVVELFDWVGDGGAPREVDISPYPVDPKNTWMPHAGNNLGVKYSRATNFVQAFLNAKFDGLTIIDMGEMPAPVDKRGEPLGEPCVDLSGMFAGSNIQMLPRGGSRRLIKSVDAMFSGCTQLRHWSPQELVAKGMAMVHDTTANVRLRGNGLDEPAFMFGLEPQSMKQFLQGCVAYDGTGVNSIKWHNLTHEDSASDFATGCHFAPHFLAGIVESMWWDRFRRKRFVIPKLRNVNLGHGRLTGEAAKHCQELRASGIEIVGPDLA